MRRFVIADPHGRKDAFLEVLKACKFDYENDRLIILGDIADGGFHTKELVDEILKIKEVIFVLGNHDKWFIDLMNHGVYDAIWLHQGGENTVISYGAKIVHMARTVTDEYELDLSEFIVPVTHQEFWDNHKLYHVEDDMLFIHGGFDYLSGIKETGAHTLLWDRRMIDDARYKHIPGYKKIFVGHTFIGMTPDLRNNVWCMDTGAGWDGVLSIMDIDTEEVWLSSVQQKPI